MSEQVVDMARTDAEKKAAEKRVTEAVPSNGPDYPYVLCLNLGAEELKKLGIEDLPEVGDEMHLYAVAKVTRVSQSASEQGEDSKGVELQITHMGVMEEGDEDDEGMSPASKLYKSAERAEGEAG
jgi:hypothetical protein